MKRYRVTLAAEEREPLHSLLARGKADVRKFKHAQILLKADEAAGAPGWGDERIAAALEVGTATVERAWSGRLPRSEHLFQSELCGQIMVRHICATGELSNPSPSFGCLKFRPIRSLKSSMSTLTSGSKAHRSFTVTSLLVMYHLCRRACS